MDSTDKNGLAFSKRLISDTRPLVWIVTIGGLLLAFYCVYSKYTGSLPWIAGMVSAVWASKGAVESFYMHMATEDHTKGHITYDAFEAQNFGIPVDPDENYKDSDEGDNI